MGDSTQLKRFAQYRAAADLRGGEAEDQYSGWFGDESGQTIDTSMPQFTRRYAGLGGQGPDIANWVIIDPDPAAVSFIDVLELTSHSLLTTFRSLDLGGATIFNQLGNFKVFAGSLVASQASTAGIADQVTTELSRLRPDWAGPGTVAPDREIIRQVEAVLDRFPLTAPMPATEVEEDDGSVALRWIAHDTSRSVSLVFTGNRSVTIVRATLDPPHSRSRIVSIDDEIEFASVFQEVQNLGILNAQIAAQTEEQL